MNRRDFLKASAAVGIAAATAKFCFDAFKSHPEATQIIDICRWWKRYVFWYDKLPPKLMIKRESSAFYFYTD